MADSQEEWDGWLGTLPNTHIASALLDLVGAPKPYARPDLVKKLAVLIAFAKLIYEQSGRRPSRPAPILPLLHKHASKLTRQLSLYQASQSDWLEQSETLLRFESLTREKEQIKARSEMERCTRLIEAIAIFREGTPAPMPRINMDWHIPAALFWEGYLEVVGKASTSRHGPAVDFVCRALECTSNGKHTKAAVGQALARLHTTTNRGTRG